MGRKIDRIDVEARRIVAELGGLLLAFVLIMVAEAYLLTRLPPVDRALGFIGVAVGALSTGIFLTRHRKEG